MQNEDEELSGLEQKLSHLKPRSLDESFLVHLSRTLQSEDTVKSDELESGSLQLAAYPSNVIWMRFAPVAAAAGVVLLGTFFMHYQSSMNDKPSVMVEAGVPATSNAVATKLEPTFVEVPAMQENASLAQGAMALPVPRLGVADFHSLDSSLVPVSGQKYLRSLDGGLDFNQALPNSATALHFAEAYHWQEEGKMKANAKAGQE